LKQLPWFQTHNALRNPRLRLICFPYAGGGASVFRKWPTFLPDGVELVAAQLPGREARYIEPPLQDIDSALSHLSAAIEPLLDRPFVFFGHSLGALVAYELTLLLRTRGLRMPEHMILSGRRAPSIPIGRRPFYDLPNEELIEEIRKLSGTSQGVLENDELMAMMLPMLRADFAIHDKYRYRESAALDVDFSVFGGLDDISTTADNLSAWESMTTRGVRLSFFRGGHFFIDEARNDVLPVIERVLVKMLESRRDGCAVM
jgi:medium-chain acyl-[acyl-carrier-protein] hydrolase